MRPWDWFRSKNKRPIPSSSTLASNSCSSWGAGKVAKTSTGLDKCKASTFKTDSCVGVGETSAPAGLNRSRAGIEGSGLDSSVSALGGEVGGAGFVGVGAAAVSVWLGSLSWLPWSKYAGRVED